MHTIFAGARIGTLTDVLYAKRLHQKQITQNRAKYFSSTVRLPSIIFARLLPLVETTERVKILVRYYIKWAIASYAQFTQQEKESNLIYLKELLAWVESMAIDDFLNSERMMLLRTIQQNTPQFKAPMRFY